MPYLSSLKFPYKLWNIVNECKSGAISWDSTGKFILINYKAFKREYLNSAIGFKTAKINSFIRQLNLYGFRKMSVNELQNIYNTHAYQNDNFVYGNHNLLKFVSRKPSGVKRQKKKYSQQNSPQNKLLITCRKAFSTALRNSANSKIMTSRRRLQFPDEKPFLDKNNFSLPIVEYNEQFGTDDVLSEYDILFQNDCSLFSDIKDHIPIALPQEISLKNKYMLPNAPIIWNEYNNNSEDCISDDLGNFSNEKNEQEIGQSIHQKDEVAMNGTATGSQERENKNKLDYDSTVSYSLDFDSSFAQNSHLAYLNVGDHLTFASPAAKVIVEPVQNSNFILNQNFVDGLGDHLIYHKNSTTESFYERYQPFNNGDFAEF